MIETWLKRNYKAIINHFSTHLKVLSMEKSGVPNAPFLILIFCKFLDYELNPIKVIAIKFSKKLINFISNSCKKSHGAGVSHFCARTNWNSVPVLMTTPVYGGHGKGMERFTRITERKNFMWSQGHFKKMCKKLFLDDSSALCPWLIYSVVYQISHYVMDTPFMQHSKLRVRGCFECRPGFITPI